MSEVPSLIDLDNYGFYFYLDKIRVFVDGNLVEACTAFNIKEGWANRYVKILGKGAYFSGDTEKVFGDIVVEGWREEFLNPDLHLIVRESA